MTNCPNCGMPINGDKCEYCGTQFIDFSTIDLLNPFVMRIKYGGKIMQFRCYTKDVNFASENAFLEPTRDVRGQIKSDGKIYYSELSMRFALLENAKTKEVEK